MSLTSLLMFSLLGSAAAEPPTTLLLSVEGMTCQGCAQGMQATLEKLDFVQSASASFETQKACVVLSAAVDEKKLRKTVEQKGKYTLTATEVVESCPS